MAIPTASVKAPARVIPVFPSIAPAKVTPTDIPSGMLCSVTARTSIVVFFKLTSGPSGCALSKCRCGTRLSSPSRKRTPPKKPTAAGIHAIFPCSVVMSIAGINSDHTEAAIITPAANPRSIFSSFLFISFLIQKTIADPSVVPANGISNPSASCIHSPYLPVVTVRPPASPLRNLPIEQSSIFPSRLRRDCQVPNSTCLTATETNCRPDFLLIKFTCSHGLCSKYKILD